MNQVLGEESNTNSSKLLKYKVLFDSLSTCCICTFTWNWAFLQCGTADIYFSMPMYLYMSRTLNAGLSLAMKYS